MDVNTFTEWWVCRDSNERDICCIPAQLTGITKRKGCIEYRTTLTLCSYKYLRAIASSAMQLNTRICKSIFGFYPKEGQLFYVKKVGRKWIKEEIELEFS